MWNQGPVFLGNAFDRGRSKSAVPGTIYMISLKYFAAVIFFGFIAPAHAVYITMPATFSAGNVSSKRNSHPDAIAIAPASLLSASAVDSEPLNAVPRAAIGAPKLKADDIANNLTANVSNLPARDGFIQYVPEPGCLFIFGAALLSFSRRRAAR